LDLSREGSDPRPAGAIGVISSDYKGLIGVSSDLGINRAQPAAGWRLIIKENTSMSESVIERVELANGLVLEILDLSRPVAGDRWRVEMAARIDVDLEKAGAPDAGPAGFEPGEPLRYEHREVRSFVDAADKDVVFEAMKRQYLDDNLSYLAHPEFAPRLLGRKIAQAKSHTPRHYRV
jgi:hypothetical protein